MYSFSSMPYKLFMIHANPVFMKAFLINTDINSCQTLTPHLLKPNLLGNPK